MINPIGVELLYRARNEDQIAGVVSKKTPVSLFCRLRKVCTCLAKLAHYYFSHGQDDIALIVSY